MRTSEIQSDYRPFHSEFLKVTGILAGLAMFCHFAEAVITRPRKNAVDKSVSWHDCCSNFKIHND